MIVSCFCFTIYHTKYNQTVLCLLVNFLEYIETFLCQHSVSLVFNWMGKTDLCIHKFSCVGLCRVFFFGWGSYFLDKKILLVVRCCILSVLYVYCIVLYCIVLYCIVLYCIYYLLTGCEGRTRKYKPKVFHTARACEGCLENQGLAFPGTAGAPS